MKTEKELKELLISLAVKLIEVTKSDCHLTDLGCNAHFIANDLKEAGDNLIALHQFQIRNKVVIP